MANGGESGVPDLTRTRIPGDVLDRIDFIVDTIKVRILQAACLRAGGQEQVNYVTEDDVLYAVTDTLRRTAAELDEQLSRRDSTHVQVRNAS